MKRAILAVSLAFFAVIAVVAAVTISEWTNPFGAPYRHQAAAPDIGGPFTLTGPDGHPVSSTSFRGKWLVVYFGYTHCPDACPTALNSIGVALDMLKSRAATVQPFFITVDPQRDGPQSVGTFAHQFSPRILGLTGTQAQITAVEHEYRVYAARHPEPGGSYSMDHSNIIYVMDPQGHFAGFVDGSANPEDIAAQLTKFEA